MFKLILFVLLVIPAIVLAFNLSPAQGQTTEPRPNIIVIETDDQRWDTLSYMPTVMSRIVGEGMKFTNYFATTSLCCPSRSSFFTGQYTHNHGVWSNFAPNGSVTRFNDTSTLATWLNGSGYATSLIGKYLNGYGTSTSPFVPPGWSDWHAFAAPDPMIKNTWYYRYTMSENGTITTFGESAADYSTDVLRDKAVNFINTAQKPFFLLVTPFAPHRFPVVANRHKNTCSTLTFDRPPSFNESDVSDKPAWVQAKASFDSAKVTDVTKMNRLEVCTLKAVDEAVAAIITALGSELDNTVIIFVSDNGFQWGEHRLIQKNTIYEESIRVPLAIRYPKLISPGTTSDKLVLNIDLPVTIAEIAGATVPSLVNGKNVNGKSLVPLFSNPSEPWRTDFLIEHAKGEGTPTMTSGVRTTQYKYVELGTGERELYDLAADPYELVNQANNPAFADIRSQLATRLQQLRSE